MGKMVYVIVNQNGDYVSDRVFTLTNEGWLYSVFTGIETGFSYFTNLLTAREYLAKFQTINKEYGFKQEFSIEYVNFKTIIKGKCNIKDIFPTLSAKKIIL